MVKVRVKNEFCDIHTGEYYPVGTELEITEDRLKEIQSSGDYVETVEQKKTRRRKNNG